MDVKERLDDVEAELSKTAKERNDGDAADADGDAIKKDVDFIMGRTQAEEMAGVPSLVISTQDLTN